MNKLIKIGTRGSPLALAQTRIFIAALEAKHPGLETRIVEITTTGDTSQGKDAPLPEGGGGKALFAKEIEDALLKGDIDCAVHSLKDLPPVQPEGLVVTSVLPREDARDVFISKKADTLEGLPRDAVLATCSPRRAAIARNLRPDLSIIPIRGNVGTRLKKIGEGFADATLLAAAGLKRLGLSNLLSHALPASVMIPAAGQGAIGIEAREKDADLRRLLAATECVATRLCVTAERAYVRGMGGSCRTPLAAFMEPPDPEGRARFEVMSEDDEGGNFRRLSYMMTIRHEGDAERLGLHAASEMKAG
jgi:hydroxymethylbilane synthase